MPLHLFKSSVSLRYLFYDKALSLFEKNDFLSYETLHRATPPADMYQIFEFLESEGLLKIDRHGVTITEKGRLKVKSGGFRRQLFKERAIFASVVIGSIAGIVSIIAFFCQFF